MHRLVLREVAHGDFRLLVLGLRHRIVAHCWRDGEVLEVPLLLAHLDSLWSIAFVLMAQIWHCAVLIKLEGSLHVRTSAHLLKHGVEVCIGDHRFLLESRAEDA